MASIYGWDLKIIGWISCDENESAYFHIDHAFILTIPDERMRVRLVTDFNPLPAQLLYCNERLVQVGIFGDQEGSKMESKSFRRKDVGRSLCQV